MRNGSIITGPLKTTHSVLASDEVARIVNAHFPVTRVADCYLLRRGFNEVYLVRCENGAKFVARLSAIRARGPATLEDIEFTGRAPAGLHIAAEGYAGPPSRFKIDADHLLHRPLIRQQEAA